jgi:hypothetical protein
MRSLRLNLTLPLAFVLSASLGPSAFANVVIDFESSSAGSAAPFSITAGGLTATFTGDGLAICDTAPSGLTLQSGNAAMVAGCVAPTGNGGGIDIGFSQSIFSASMNFGTFPPTDVQLTALQGGILVGAITATGVDTGGNGEGIIQFGDGVTPFDEIQLNTGTPFLSIDNLDLQTEAAAVPEPASLMLTAGALLILVLRRRR